MRPPRLVLVSSPVPRGHAELSCDRQAQTIESIRVSHKALWVGWTEGRHTEADPTSADARLASGDQRVGIAITSDLVRPIRDQLINEMLRPLLYGRPDLVCHCADAFRAWIEANAALAGRLRLNLGAGDVVWVHDFAHIPIGAALRRSRFSGPLGFLLHAPFPVPDQLMTLPEHKELLTALCSYDFVGFQSAGCRENFRHAVESLLGRIARPGAIPGPFGAVKTGVFECPVDVDAVAQRAHSAVIQRRAGQIRQCHAGRTLIASIATLNHTQAVVAQVRGFGLLIERHPALQRAVSLVQAIPGHSRWLEEDASVREQLEQTLMHINGRFATIDWTPIQYLHKTLSQAQQIALYRASRAGVFLPFGDGGSAPAKDFVAAQHPDNPGVLVLSRFAGGASDLDGPLLVNPYDEATIAEALEAALAMPLLERRQRWTSLMRQLRRTTLNSFASAYLKRLAPAHAALENEKAA